jgi:phage-related protein
MAEPIGEATVTIRPDTKGFDDEARSKIGGALGTLAKVGTAAFAGLTVAAIGFGKTAVSEGAEAAQMAGQTAAAIKSTGGAAKVTADQVAELSGRLGDLAGVDDEAVQKGENLLLTFTNIKNEAGAGNDIFNQASLQMVNLAARMGTDAAGGAIQLGKALNDPVKGVTALQRVGVSFTDQQKQQIAAMVAAGNVMGAQKIILAELNTEFGGSAEAMGKALPPMERLRLIFNNVAEDVGGSLIPVLNTLVPAISPVIQALGPALGGVAIALVPLLQSLAQVVGTTIVPAIQGIMPGLTALIGGLGAGLASALQGVGPLLETLAFAMGDILKAFAPVLPVVGRLAGTLAGSMVPVVEALTPMLVNLVKASLPLVELLAKIAEVVLVVLTPGLAKLAPLILGVVLALKAWSVAQAILNIELLANPIGLLIVAVAALVAAIAGAVVLIVGHWDAIKRAFGDAVSWIGNALSTAWSAVTGFVSTVGEWFGKLPGLIGDALAKAVAFLADLPAQMAYWAGYAVGAFLRFFIELPGRLWDALTAAWNTIVVAVPRIVDAVVDFGRRAVEGAVAFFSALPGHVANFIGAIPGAIAGAAKAAVAAVADFGRNLVDGFVNFVKNLPNLMGDIADAVLAKLKGLASAAFNAMKDWASNLWKGFKAGLGISSPSLIEDAMSAIVGNVNRSVDQLKTSVGQMNRLPTGDFGIAGGVAAAGAGGTLQINLDGETLARVVYDQLLKMERRQGPLFATT